MREQQRSLDRTYIPERKFINSSRIGFRVIKTLWVYISACFVKFIYSEEATKFCEIFTLLLTVCTVVKSKVKISQNFVAFSEYMNFIDPRICYDTLCTLY